MSWLKRTWSSLAMALVAFLAFMAATKASQRRAEAKKWQKVATEEKERDVVDAVDNANVALGQAKLHAAEAERIAKNAEKRLDDIAKRDDTMGDIMDRWRADRLRNDDA